MAQWLLHVTPSRSDANTMLEKVGARTGLDPQWLEAAPGVLVGSVARCVEKLHELRDHFGISYVQLDAGPRSTDRDRGRGAGRRRAGRLSREAPLYPGDRRSVEERWVRRGHRPDHVAAHEVAELGLVEVTVLHQLPRLGQDVAHVGHVPVPDVGGEDAVQPSAVGQEPASEGE